MASTAFDPSSPAPSYEGFVTFNGWTKGNQNIGHFSFTYGQRMPQGEILWSKYHAIQPNRPYLANIFFSVFPLKARAITQLEEDCRLEGSRRGGPRKPDCQYTFPATASQISAIDEYVINSERQMELGSERYTYLPGLRLIDKFMQAMAAMPGLDDIPTRSDASNDLPPNEKFKQSHCVTKVRDVGNLLGLPISDPKPFFVSTPQMFEKEIEEIAQNTPGATIIKTEYQPSLEETLDEVPI